MRVCHISTNQARRKFVDVRLQRRYHCAKPTPLFRSIAYMPISCSLHWAGITRKISAQLGVPKVSKLFRLLKTFLLSSSRLAARVCGAILSTVAWFGAITTAVIIHGYWQLYWPVHPTGHRAPARGRLMCNIGLPYIFRRAATALQTQSTWQCRWLNNK